MIRATHPLTVTRRCALLAVARSTAYYQPTGVSPEDLAVMRLLDAIHLARPFYGSRRLRDELEDQGHRVNRKRVQRLMRQMGLRALYPKPRTSQPGDRHKIYPYLLTGLRIERPNQVWASDICYIPMATGFMYLVAIMDWYSRRVLAWRVSNTLDSDFCVEALEDALTRYGTPEIFNTDQGAQFTSEAFTTVLKAHAVAISMDGKGRWVDNVFIERLWRSVKYEDVYLHAYETPASLRAGLNGYFQFYNGRRRHSSLGRRTPDVVYFEAAGFGAAARNTGEISLKTLSSFQGPLLLPALGQAGYTYFTQVNVGQRLGGGRHIVDVLAEKDAKRILVSMKWQQVGVTAEQKVPFEVISLIDAVRSGRYANAYLVLGGEGWSLREFYTGGGLDGYIKGIDSVDIVRLESFVAEANRGHL